MKPPRRAVLTLVPSDHEGAAASGITRPGGAIPETAPRESRRLRLVRTLRKVETVTLRPGATPWRDAEKRKGGSDD